MSALLCSRCIWTTLGFHAGRFPHTFWSKPALIRTTRCSWRLGRVLAWGLFCPSTNLSSQAVLPGPSPTVRWSSALWLDGPVFSVGLICGVGPNRAQQQTIRSHIYIYIYNTIYLGGRPLTGTMHFWYSTSIFCFGEV